MRGSATSWTNSSVVDFAGRRDPVEAIVQAARDAVLQGLDKGWEGPPFNPIHLAELRGLTIAPRGDILDARTVPSGGHSYVIEYNPERPSGRLRFSIAHEIAHTFFPDCGERVRNRGMSHIADDPDGWQLEALCNIAAAEMLMPIGSLREADLGSLDIDSVIRCRQKFQVSTEAVLVRLAHLSMEPCAIFVASRRGARESAPCRVDYSIPARSWSYGIPRGFKFPPSSPPAECTAIGYTAKGEIMLPKVAESFRVECTGIAPYPGAIYPRVAGFICGGTKSESPRVRYLKGNALEPRDADPKIITHVVSDSTPNWGGRGFAIQLRKKWPSTQEDFRAWAANKAKLHLGDVHFSNVDAGLSVASLVCQKGYGESSGPRIRYAALETALRVVAEKAVQTGASIHMPRMGCGQAGGSWFIVEELIESTLLRKKIPVTVYDPPGIEERQGQMPLSPSKQLPLG